MILRLLLGSDSGLDEDEDVAGGDDNLLLFSPGTPVLVGKGDGIGTRPAVVVKTTLL